MLHAVKELVAFSGGMVAAGGALTSQPGAAPHLGLLLRPGVTVGAVAPLGTFQGGTIQVGEQSETSTGAWIHPLLLCLSSDVVAVWLATRSCRLQPPPTHMCAGTPLALCGSISGDLSCYSVHSGDQLGFVQNRTVALQVELLRERQDGGSVWTPLLTCLAKHFPGLDSLGGEATLQPSFCCIAWLGQLLEVAQLCGLAVLLGARSEPTTIRPHISVPHDSLLQRWALGTAGRTQTWHRCSSKLPPEA